MYEHHISVECPKYGCEQKIYYGVSPDNRCFSNGCDSMMNCEECINCVRRAIEKINNFLRNQS